VAAEALWRVNWLGVKLVTTVSAIGSVFFRAHKPEHTEAPAAREGRLSKTAEAATAIRLGREEDFER
jgi:hypothetical protein